MKAEDGTVVFLGPTLPASAASKLIDAHILPPASVGDVYRAARNNSRFIVLIDGYFERIPAVWHKEILYALSRGVTVVGCSSMGALRAAELHLYGMHGHGEIFLAYRDEVYEDDDEVAVAHGTAESGYRCVSDALVNIRYGLSVAQARSLISDTSRQCLERLAKSWYYADRHWAALIDAGHRLALPEEEMRALRQFVREVKPDLKRLDAEETLSLVCAGRFKPPPTLPLFNFERTNSWQWLEHLESTEPL